MTNKSRQRCSISLATRETQTHTTILFHKLEITVFDILEIITHVSDNVKKLDPS